MTNRVRERREALGLSRKALAAIVDLHPSMIYKIEIGRCDTTTANAHRLAAALNVPLAALFPPETPSTPAPEATATDLVAPGSAA